MQEHCCSTHRYITKQKACKSPDSTEHRAQSDRNTRSGRWHAIGTAHMWSLYPNPRLMWLPARRRSELSAPRALGRPGVAAAAHGCPAAGAPAGHPNECVYHVLHTARHSDNYVALMLAPLQATLTCAYIMSRIHHAIQIVGCPAAGAPTWYSRNRPRCHKKACKYLIVPLLAPLLAHSSLPWRLCKRLAWHVSTALGRRVAAYA